MRKVSETSPEPDRDDASEAAPRFVVDAMLGRLARWLRMLGFDAVFNAEWDDLDLIRCALRERRRLLTRDHGLLARRAIRRSNLGLLVDADDLATQLRIVLGAAGIGSDDARLFSRCAVCNGLLDTVSTAEVRGQVPPYVARTASRFARCPDCNRIYWDGTHTRLARRQLSGLIGRTTREPGSGGT